jgi:hypothetical protein
MERGLTKYSPRSIQKLIQSTQNEPALIPRLETKLIATKSTKYLQQISSNYKFIFNHTYNATTCSKRRNLNYAPYRGGLMTLIHKNYSFMGNIQKIATPNEISPYLQIIKIKNKPLNPITIINIYMPTHPKDIQLIPIMKERICNTINTSQTHTIIVLGDFNRDIKLIGRHNEITWTPPNKDDIEWAKFTKTLKYTYLQIPNTQDKEVITIA